MEQTPIPPRHFSVIKILAAVLFIVLPLIGFWLGMEYQESTMYIEQTQPITHPNKLPILSPDKTTKWETYKSIHGFAFKYPVEPKIDYSFYDGPDYLSLRNEVAYYSHDKADDFEFNIRIERYNFPEDISLSEMVKKYGLKKETVDHSANTIIEAINKQSKAYKNSYIEGLIVNRNDFTDLPGIVILAKHNLTLFEFLLFGREIYGSDLPYLPPQEEAVTIFHTMLSTFTFTSPENQTPGYYEDELIRFSYPSHWKISKGKNNEKNFNITIDENYNLFYFNLNGHLPKDTTFEKNSDGSLLDPTSYPGFRNAGYGEDYTIVYAKTENISVSGLSGTRHVYYQQPANPEVGSINWIIIPINDKEYYTIEYSGADKQSLEMILNSISFKN